LSESGQSQKKCFSSLPNIELAAEQHGLSGGLIISGGLAAGAIESGPLGETLF